MIRIAHGHFTLCPANHGKQPRRSYHVHCISHSKVQQDLQVTIKGKLTLIISAQVGCEGAALATADFFAVDLVEAGFLADIVAIYGKRSVLRLS